MFSGYTRTFLKFVIAKVKEARRFLLIKMWGKAELNDFALVNC